MKRFICLLLALTLALLALSGCDRRSEAPEATADPAASPEATPLGGLTGAVEQQGAEEALDEFGAFDSELPPETDEGEDAPSDDGESEEQPSVEDEPLTDADAPEGDAGDEEPEVTPDPDDDSPFATPTPQPNAAVSGYSEVSAEGLGFRFSYPTGWTNIPGRSTVCYVQPLEDGTVYPARVAVTMKRLLHKTEGMDEAKQELADYYEVLMAQYGEDTFRVNTKLDEETRFMGKRALSTTYVAYDGPQEIKGYTIITYFERYLFVFHFLCAYEDYDSFESAMRYMRDSVQADTSVAPN